MRVLVVGVGSMGTRHAKNALALGHDVAALDPIATLVGVATFVSDREAYRWRPDAVVIATPARTHAKLVHYWLGRAQQVFVEKPLAMSMSDFWADGTGQTSGRVCVGYQLRFQPHARELRRWIRGKVGYARSAVVECRVDGTKWPGRDYADALLECSHEIDLANFVLGHPHCYGAHVSESGKSWELTAKCGETLTQISLSTEYDGYRRGIAIVASDGTEGYWAWHSPSDRSVLELEGKRHELSGIDNDVYLNELEAFLTGRWVHQHGCDLASAAATLKFCDDARKLATRPARENA